VCPLHIMALRDFTFLKKRGYYYYILRRQKEEEEEEEFYGNSKYISACKNMQNIYIHILRRQKYNLFQKKKSSQRKPKILQDYYYYYYYYNSIITNLKFQQHKPKFYYQLSKNSSYKKNKIDLLLLPRGQNPLSYLLYSIMNLNTTISFLPW